MEQWASLCINQKQSIFDAIQVIDKGARQIALVIDAEGTLLGVVTDGDIRRGLLKGIALEQEVSLVMNSTPKVATLTQSKEEIFALMQSKSLHQIPIVDEENRVISLETMDNYFQKQTFNNPVFILAGGLGTRLRPLTNDCPKPLLKIDRKPVLQIILEQLIEDGFHHFIFSINYKKDMIRDYFGDGKTLGVTIEYVEEVEPLGTAGPLSLLKEKSDLPILVMNGDIMTQMNFQHLLRFHHKQQADATICVRAYQQTVPYGVVKINDNELVALEEKPVESYFVNAGIYLLEPKVLELIPTAKKYDMPDLIQQLINTGKDLKVFPIREYWNDIGRLEDFQKAHKDYQDLFV